MRRSLACWVYRVQGIVCSFSKCAIMCILHFRARNRAIGDHHALNGPAKQATSSCGSAHKLDGPHL